MELCVVGVIFSFKIPVFSLQANFHIAATGVILDLDKSVTVVKKLKLIGYPSKIFKNTCFVKVGKPLFTSVYPIGISVSMIPKIGLARYD